MSKEYYLSLMRQSGIPEAIIVSLKRNTEDELKLLLSQFSKKKKGPKIDTITADDVISKIKSKPLTLGDEVSFDLIAGKGGTINVGKVTGHFITYRTYAVIEYFDERKNKRERKEVDIFKLKG